MLKQCASERQIKGLYLWKYSPFKVKKDLITARMTTARLRKSYFGAKEERHVIACKDQLTPN